MGNSKGLIAAFAVLYAMIGIGYAYKKCVSADEATFLDHAPPVKIPLGVSAPEYSRAKNAAVKLWHTTAGCELFTPGNDVQIIPSNGARCGAPFAGDSTARAYKCSGHYEVQISYPGDLGHQTCIIFHELGHVLGLADDTRSSGAMYKHFCTKPGAIRLSDKDTKAIKSRYCND